ncbi:DUF4946 domain-containing protein, partial [Pseudomonas syringae]|nr:DUF4946 domain-containing protein [Pseudomonas syringae]
MILSHYRRSVPSLCLFLLLGTAQV